MWQKTELGTKIKLQILRAKNMGQSLEPGLESRLRIQLHLSATAPEPFIWPSLSIPVTSGPVSSPGWRRIFLWAAEVPKSLPSSAERELGQCSGRLGPHMGSGLLLTLHLPCMGPLHLLAPRMGAATGYYRWVHANSKYLQHHGSSSSPGAGLALPPDSGHPTSHLREHGMRRGTQDWRRT